jgi:hypothetical protein
MRIYFFKGIYSLVKIADEMDMCSCIDQPLENLIRNVYSLIKITDRIEEEVLGIDEKVEDI